MVSIKVVYLLQCANSCLLVYQNLIKIAHSLRTGGQFLCCVVYKLALGVIADRLKPYLNQVISQGQTGFIKGRQISDSTRLVYDLLHITETKGIPGLLMLIDFEKIKFDQLDKSA